jgi:hypothetical protein
LKERNNQGKLLFALSLDESQLNSTIGVD